MTDEQVAYGKYRTADRGNGCAVVLDHNGMSIIGVVQSMDGTLTPAFSEPMAARIAALLNGESADQIAADVIS